jgi:hypothetical protein
MTADEKEKNLIFEQLNVAKDKAVPSVSFLDDLDVDTLNIVELIMIASTGQKDIIHQIKSMHQLVGDFNAA